MIRRHLVRSLVLSIVISAAMAFCCDLRVAAVAGGRVYNSTETIPEMPVALLLWTAKTYHGHENAFYTTRIRAAAELYHSGKIRGILVSGDHGRPDYNEPQDMRQDLMHAGVPSQYITLDYAGFRTLDSVVRAKEVFGQSKLAIVSQRFHVERALYPAQKAGIAAVGYVAQDPPIRTSRIKVRAREVLARAAAVFDSFIDRDGTGERRAIASRRHAVVKLDPFPEIRGKLDTVDGAWPGVPRQRYRFGFGIANDTT
ncbi:MAG: YdcF family protein [Verrucomicrobia bacterium]|nr:YdcF family protein [Verrucomicrobiota bacterium]